MSLSAAHATVILSRDPYAAASPLGTAIPSRLTFTLDLLHAPDLPVEMAQPLLAWALQYFDAHPDEHTEGNIHQLASYVHNHADWVSDETMSTLMMSTLLT